MSRKILEKETILQNLDRVIRPSMTRNEHIALFHDPRRQPPRIQWTPDNIVHAGFASADIVRLVEEMHIGVLHLPDSLENPENIGRLERQLAVYQANLRRAAESISLTMQREWAQNTEICVRTANDNIKKTSSHKKKRGATEHQTQACA